MVKELTFGQAVNNFLLNELRTNRNSVYLAEDSNTFLERFEFEAQISMERKIDLVDSEESNMGLAIGLALSGFNAIIKIDGTGYMFRTLSQLVDYAKKVENSSDTVSGSLLAICLCGVTSDNPALDNECIESVLAHFPGINVLYPSTLVDTIGLMRSSMKQPKPTVLLLDKRLLNSTKDSKLTELPNTHIGKAKIIKSGSSVSVISYGPMLSNVKKAAIAARKSGVSVEIIDLRTISPFDSETIIESVKKTGKAIIINEDYKSCSIGAEIVASLVQSEAFDYLEAPIIRMCNNNNVLPYSEEKMNKYLPDSKELLEIIIDLAKYK